MLSDIITVSVKIQVGKENTYIYATHKGTLHFTTTDGAHFTVRDVLFASDLPVCLLSMNQLSLTHRVVFQNEKCSISPIVPSHHTQPQWPIFTTMTETKIPILHAYIGHTAADTTRRTPTTAPIALAATTATPTTPATTTTPASLSPGTSHPAAPTPVAITSATQPAPSRHPPARFSPKRIRQLLFASILAEQDVSDAYPPLPPHEVLVAALTQDPSTAPTELTSTQTLAPRPTAEQQRRIHERLGHKSPRLINRLYNLLHSREPHKYPSNPIQSRRLQCIVCNTSKPRGPTINKEPARNSNSRGLVHTDTVPVSVPALGTKDTCWIVFHDDETKHTQIYTMKSKTESLKYFDAYTAMRHLQGAPPISRIRSDSGTEYTCAQFTDALLLKGVIAEHSLAYCHSKNGVAERAIKSLKHTQAALMQHSRLPSHFWAYALGYAAYLGNLLPCEQRGGTIPSEQFFKRTFTPASLDQVHQFGCFATQFLPEERRQPGLFPECANLAIFVGINDDGNAHFYNPKTLRCTASGTGAFQIFDELAVDAFPRLNLAYDVISKPLPSSRGLNSIFQISTMALPPPPTPTVTVQVSPTSPPSSASDTTAPATASSNPTVPAPAISPTPTVSTTTPSTLPPAPATTAPATAPAAPATTHTSDDAAIPVTTPPLSRPTPAPFPAQTRTHTLATDDPPPLPNSQALSQPSLPDHSEPRRYQLRSSVALIAPQPSYAALLAQFRNTINDIPQPDSSQTPAHGHVSREPHPDGIPLSLIYSIRAEPAQPPPQMPIAIPQGYRAATSQENPNRQTWIDAMERELSGLEENNTFDRTQLMPADTHALHFLWVYSYSVTKAMPKARLVARGDQQVAHDDYDPARISATTCRTATIRIFLALAAMFGWYVYQADIAQAFVQSKLTEHQVWIKNPYGGPALRLHKSLYGLKQAGSLWQHELAHTLAKAGYFPTKADSCAFARRLNPGEQQCFITVFVDDLVFFSPDKAEITRVQQHLEAHYKLFDLGVVHKLLGFVITRDTRGTFSISQEPYARGILSRFGAELDLKPHPTPLPAKLDLEANPGHASKAEIVAFQGAVGTLLYLATGSRPDISFALSKLSQFSQNPSDVHRFALKHLLGYISGTLDYKLFYHRNGEATPSAYCDADHAGCKVTYRSTTGCTFLVGNSLVHWFSRRQPTVTLSSTDAETVAATSAATEMVWLRQLFADCGMPLDAPSVLHCDNLSTIAASKQQWNQSKSKTIALRMCYLKEQIEFRSIILVPVSTHNQTADFLTKNVSGPTLKRLLHKLNTGKPGSFSTS